MPSTIYIEDENARVTLVSAQPLGASSLDEGEMEVGDFSVIFINTSSEAY